MSRALLQRLKQSCLISRPRICHSIKIINKKRTRTFLPLKMYAITPRYLGLACKKRLFHSSAILGRAFKPGFFNSFKSIDKEQPKEVLAAYPIKTSKDTYSCNIPPIASKMLVRDFIDDSLYNPHYGFYSKNIISALSEFEEMDLEEDQIQYMRRVVKSRGRVHHHHIQHLRYTLTELFKVSFFFLIKVNKKVT